MKRKLVSTAMTACLSITASASSSVPTVSSPAEFIKYKTLVYNTDGTIAITSAYYDAKQFSEFGTSATPLTRRPMLRGALVRSSTASCGDNGTTPYQGPPQSPAEPPAPTPPTETVDHDVAVVVYVQYYGPDNGWQVMNTWSRTVDPDPNKPDGPWTGPTRVESRTGKGDAIGNPTTRDDCGDDPGDGDGNDPGDPGDGSGTCSIVVTPVASSINPNLSLQQLKQQSALIQANAANLPPLDARHGYVISGRNPIDCE